MPTDKEIIERLERIEQMLKDMAFANSPASLSAEEKSRIVIAAIPKGKAAVKEAFRIINGM